MRPRCPTTKQSRVTEEPKQVMASSSNANSTQLVSFGIKPVVLATWYLHGSHLRQLRCVHFLHEILLIYDRC